MAFMEETPRTFKVVLLGDVGVGKTSLLLRYVKGVFAENKPATLSGNFLTKTVDTGGQLIYLNVWDTAGQERFDSLTPIYYRGADAALLVFDITDPSSLTRVKNWARELRRSLGQDILIVFAANKTDRERDRLVPKEEARMFAESIGTNVYDISAKAGKGVYEAFADIAQRVVERADAAHTKEPEKHQEYNVRPGNSSGNIRLHPQEQQRQQTANQGSCMGVQGACAPKQDRMFEECFLDIGGEAKPQYGAQIRPRRPGQGDLNRKSSMRREETDSGRARRGVRIAQGF